MLRAKRFLAWCLAAVCCYFVFSWFQRIPPSGLPLRKTTESDVAGFSPKKVLQLFLQQYFKIQDGGAAQGDNVKSDNDSTNPTQQDTGSDGNRGDGNRGFNHDVKRDRDGTNPTQQDTGGVGKRNININTSADNSEDVTPALQEEAPSPVQSDQVSKVLLFTYMRGGSSLLGEMFNRHTDAFYWFEPVNGFYSHLYGNTQGMQPLDIFFNQDDTVREMPKLETDTLLQGLQDIYNCNMENLPVDVLANFLMFTIDQKTLRPYTDCLKTGKRPGDAERALKPSFPFGCKRLTKPYCPVVFEKDRSLEKCQDQLYAAHESLRKHEALTAGPPDTGYIPENVTEAYVSCMNRSYPIVSYCSPVLTKICTSAKIRAIKEIRFRLDMVEKIIEVIPDIKVVVLFRDPRGIVSSRRRTSLLSHVGKNLTHESKLLCQRLEQELRALTRLEQTHPNNVMRLTYETMVQAPLDTLRTIYRFIEQPLAKTILDWFVESFNAEKDGGAYNTVRKNGTETAFNWSITMDRETFGNITSYCSDVLSSLGYQVT